MENETKNVFKNGWWMWTLFFSFIIHKSSEAVCVLSDTATAAGILPLEIGPVALPLTGKC